VATASGGVPERTNPDPSWPDGSVGDRSSRPQRSRWGILIEQIINGETTTKRIQFLLEALRKIGLGQAVCW
jgi:hypothetical protein